MSQQLGFVGSWQVTATDSPGPPNVSLGTFGADGTVVASPPPVFPPQGSSGGESIFTSAGHGAWDATGADTAVITFVVLTADSQGQPLLTVTISANLTLGADGHTFNGEGIRTFADPGGNVVMTEPAIVEGARIVAEAPGMATTATSAAAAPAT